MKIATLPQLEIFLKTRIPTREALFAGNIGLLRAKYFMKLLGDPQNKIKVIHIAGTSGKGSTATIMSHALASQGLNVGLSLSPHVIDVRERMQINNQLPNEKLVIKYFHQILPTILKMEKCKYGMPTYFEIIVGLAFWMFEKEKLDYAVIETGLGGLLDMTNTVTMKNKVCILTKIGLDHTQILGKTIKKIAEQKAAIIQNENIVISTEQAISAKAVIKKECEKRKTAASIIDTKNYQVISSTSQETVFDFKFNSLILQKVKLGLLGIHQAENCSLSLACLAMLSERDNFSINEKNLRKALEKISFAGRMEIRKIGTQTLIIDGAHNPQKMEVFTTNLAKIFPKQKLSFIVAFKKGKDYKDMLKQIIPIADKIFLTNFSLTNQDDYWSSADNIEIEKFLKSKNFTNFETINNKKTNILATIKASKKPVVITGSLYLIASIYKYL